MDAGCGEFLREGADGCSRLAGDLFFKSPIGERFEKTFVVFGAFFQGEFHGGGPDAAWGRIDNAQKRDVILRIDETGHRGKDVLHFAAVEKAFASDETIRNSHAAKVFFEEAGLRIHPVDDGKMFPRDLLGVF